MGELAVVILTVALAAYAGFTNASPIYAAPVAVASAFYVVVISGRRAPSPDGGMFMSMLWCLVFSVAVCTIGYVIGYGIARLAN
jgi:hypothetical protein